MIPPNKFLTVLAIGVLTLMACNDDDTYMSAWREDLAELYTVSDGRVDRLVLDDGTAFRVENSVVLQSPDTVRRVFCAFVETDIGQARLGSYKFVVTIDPLSSAGRTIVQDPLSVVSAWRAGNYVNLKLDLKTGPSSKSHIFGFYEQAIEPNPNGGKMLKLVLHHDQNSDDLYYTRSIYLSAALRNYANRLAAGDSISLSVQTFAGEKTYKFAY